MAGELKPQLQEEIHGHAEVRQLFKASKVGRSLAAWSSMDPFSGATRLRVIRAGKVLHYGRHLLSPQVQG